jgi:hypothetical protein
MNTATCCPRSNASRPSIDAVLHLSNGFLTNESAKIEPLGAVDTFSHGPADAAQLRTRECDLSTVALNATVWQSSRLMNRWPNWQAIGSTMSRPRPEASSGSTMYSMFRLSPLSCGGDDSSAGIRTARQYSNPVPTGISRP